MNGASIEEGVNPIETGKKATTKVSKGRAGASRVVVIVVVIASRWGRTALETRALRISRRNV